MIQNSLTPELERFPVNENTLFQQCGGATSHTDTISINAVNNNTCRYTAESFAKLSGTIPRMYNCQRRTFGGYSIQQMTFDTKWLLPYFPLKEILFSHKIVSEIFSFYCRTMHV